MKNISKGDWIEISSQILTSSERASNLPDDTAAMPYVMKTRGTAMENGQLGEEILIQTPSGRQLKGKAEEIDPYYTHDFGECVPELVEIRKTIRAMMKGVKK